MNTSIDDLWQLIKDGRNHHIEWFSEQSMPELLAETLVAMANSHGGTVLLGISGHNGNVIGVRDPDEVVDSVLQAALAIDPQLIVPLPQVVRLSGKSVVIIQVPNGMPHVYGVKGRYLQRRGIENTPLNPPELRKLVIERGEASFETEVAAGANISDLDWEKVKTYTNNISGMSDRTPEQILLKRGCISDLSGTLKPTYAGILLFGKDPQRFVRSADITAARFASETMGDRFTRQDMSGTLPDQIRRAETFLADNLRRGVQLGSTMARAESFEYPMEAARELVVNAVAHRDYRISGDGIRLFIFSNRMEVTSPGGLPGPVTIANIKDERFSRNPAIVQVLSDMGFIERLGYGVDRVIDLMQQQQLGAPEFEETAGGFRVVLRNTSQPKTHTSSNAGASLNGAFRGIEINPRQEEAIQFLSREGGNKRITNSDLQSLCPDVHPETIRRDLADLVTKRILIKMGQKRGSYYVFKHELVESE